MTERREKRQTEDSMAPVASKKRKVLEAIQSRTHRPKKKFRKQQEYHSSSSDEDEGTAVDLVDSGGEAAGREETPKKTTNGDREESSAGSEDSEDSEDSEGSNGSDLLSGADDGSTARTQVGLKARSKRNDPAAFSTSISKILAAKLPASVRTDPVLARSRSAAQTSAELSNEKLEKLARAKLRAEKKEDLDRGRVRDVLGTDRAQAGEVAEEEKRLRKTAQRGVVKLFNAVRAAQIRGEQAAREEKKKGTVGIGERERAVNQVSKQSFLELINGNKGKPLGIEEA